MLLNPGTADFAHLDEKSRQLMLKTIAFFENKGKKKVRQDHLDRVWYADFLAFVRENQVFATLLTPPEYAAENTAARWDTHRNCDFNEILGFYGLAYWYTWQVSILGLGPIWMSKNNAAKQKAAQMLREGGIFAFGLSEKAHGADLYSSEMTLTPLGQGRYVADGGKYYIGNANEAAMVSTFGKNSETGDYVFFIADPKHPNYDLVQNVVAWQSYVAEFSLSGYPVANDDILAQGREAWDTALNTVNVGKYNLGWASIGICTHALYESIQHAANRKLFGRFVTDFPHIRRLFVDAYTRLVAMRLFAARTADYIRSASTSDRRYLLYSPIVKMKVTTQGEEVVDLLWDVIAARGFEKDMYFENATQDIRALPKLEGTVHVNMALIIKFMANYFFNPGSFDEISRHDGALHDAFLFNQGPTRGLGAIRFHDYTLAYNSIRLPNIECFKSQIDVLRTFLQETPPDAKQAKEIDFLLNLGELFTLVAYGQLLIEKAAMDRIADELLDQIFDFMVRDFSKFALRVLYHPLATERQVALCREMIKQPIHNNQRFEAIWENEVSALKDAYTMAP